MRDGSRSNKRVSVTLLRPTQTDTCDAYVSRFVSWTSEVNKYRRQRLN
ncbi:hypothetical protein AVEN_273115-1, partial [Araneus ventricosus]